MTITSTSFAWDRIRSLINAVSNGDSGITSLPYYLAQVLESESWREFQPPMGPVRRPATFREFVEAKPLDGLGTTVETIEALIKSHPDKAERLNAQRALRQALKGRPGRPKGEEIGSNYEPIPQNTDTTDYALQRLHDQAPELYCEVEAGTLSVHAAAVKAGFRRPTATVRLDDPRKAVGVLLKHYTREQLLTALEA